MRPVLVHGGGKPIDRAMAAAGLKPRKVPGRRYTDEATLAIVVRVLLRRNQRRHRPPDPPARRPGRRPALPARSSACSANGSLAGTEGEPIDLGRVGQVTRVDAGLIDGFLPPPAWCR